MEYELREYEADYRDLRRDRSRSRAVAQNEQPKKVSDLMTSVIMTQMVVFSLILLLFFAFYKTESKTFIAINEFYNSIMQKDLTAKDLADCVRSVIAFVSEPNNRSSEETAVEEELTGAGGEDLMYVDGTTASFSPVFFSKPMVKPVEYTRITSRFGYRMNPVTNKYGFHSGVDLAAKSGTPIKAAFDGKIVKASYSDIRGNYIFLESEGNITTVYCHCSELIAEEGANVRAGEIIAKVGSTGQATGPHLHFEIRIGSVRHNPLWVLES